jgi:hypothetical protein
MQFFLNLKEKGHFRQNKQDNNDFDFLDLDVPFFQASGKKYVHFQ